MLGSAAVAAAVIHSGFLAYDAGVFSKHRGLVFDIDFVTLMGPVGKCSITQL